MQTDEKAANGFIHHHPWLLTVDRYALASVHKVLHDALGRPAAAAAVAADPKLLRQDPQHLKQVTHPHRRFSSGWRRIRAPPVSYKSGAQLLRSLQLWRGHLTGGTEGLFVGSTTLRSSSEPSWFERLLSPHSRTMRVADAGVAAHGGHRGRAAARRPATRARHGLPRGAHHARPPAGVSQLGGGAHCAAGQTGASPPLRRSKQGEGWEASNTRERAKTYAWLSNRAREVCVSWEVCPHAQPITPPVGCHQLP